LSHIIYKPVSAILNWQIYILRSVHTDVRGRSMAQKHSLVFFLFFFFLTLYSYYGEVKYKKLLPFTFSIRRIFLLQCFKNYTVKLSIQISNTLCFVNFIKVYNKLLHFHLTTPVKRPKPYRCVHWDLLLHIFYNLLQTLLL